MKLLKRSVWLVIAAAVIFMLVRAFKPSAVLVDVAPIERGPLVVTVDDDGRTRVRERYTISAPIGGRLLRTVLRPGDEVEASGTLLAEFEPQAPGLLDARSRSEAEARLRRAEAAVREAEARVEQARADDRFARNELERMRKLLTEGIQTAEQVERAERDARSAEQGLEAQTFAAQVASYELELARASLVEAPPTAGADDGASLEEVRPAERAEGTHAPRLFLRSPIHGKVLRVFEESARTLQAGEPILEVGNTGALEIVAEYLSQDAVKVKPGMQASIEGWGDDETLSGRVRLVEPGGFTKVSALGVEEQRVNIIIDPVGDEERWAALGDGYRVEVRIILWEEPDVLVVPTGALFREGHAWHVFAVADGRATRREVEIGKRNGLEAQVLAGLSSGDRVILYPSELIADGALVDVR